MQSDRQSVLRLSLENLTIIFRRLHSSCEGAQLRFIRAATLLGQVLRQEDTQMTESDLNALIDRMQSNLDLGWTRTSDPTLYRTFFQDAWTQQLLNQQIPSFALKSTLADFGSELHEASAFAHQMRIRKRMPKGLSPARYLEVLDMKYGGNSNIRDGENSNMRDGGNSNIQD